MKHQVDRLTQLLERSLDNTERLLSASPKPAAGNYDGGGPDGPSTGPHSTLGAGAGHGIEGNALPAGAAAALAPPAPAVHPCSSTSHPKGWFYGKLPSFGTCGGKRGSLTQIWQVWGGAGPGKVTGGECGFSLRAHGETSIKEQEVWGSTSNYGRYLQAGRYMDSKIAAIKVGRVGTWYFTSRLVVLWC